MKPAVILGLGAIAAAILIKRDEQPATNKQMVALVQNDIRTQTEAATGIFNSDAVIQGNILQRAVDEGWTTQETFSALQPGYTDPNFGWTDRLTGDLKGQLRTLINRGSTYDMYHAAAIAAYLDGITPSVVQWPTSGSGTAGRQAFIDAGLWGVLPALYSRAQALAYA